MILLGRERFNKLPGSNKLIPIPHLIQMNQMYAFRYDKERKTLAEHILKSLKFSFDKISEIVKSLKNLPDVRGVRLKISIDYDYPVLSFGDFNLEAFFYNFDESGLFLGETLIFNHFICQPLLIDKLVIGYIIVNYKDNDNLKYLIDLVKTYTDILDKQLLLSLEYEKFRSERKLINHERKHYKHWHKRDKLLLSMVMHDLKSPLQAVSGYIKLLKRKNKSINLSDFDHIFNRIEYGITDISSMVNQINELLNYTVSNITINFIDIEINWLIEETVNFMKGFSKERNQSLTFYRSTEPIYLQTDIDKVKRIVENLINNAIKHTPNGGHIEVRLIKEEGNAVIKVKDNGTGIPEEIINHIFEPYYTYDYVQSDSDSFLSMGLGLYNSSLFSRLLGGRLNVKSKMNEGTVFSFYHPISHNSQKTLKSFTTSVGKIIEST